MIARRRHLIRCHAPIEVPVLTNQTEQRFSSRLGLLLCVLGIAVGTGNIWRFPRIAAQNAGDDGAGAFLVAWLVFLFVWSVPFPSHPPALKRC